MCDKPVLGNYFTLCKIIFQIIQGIIFYKFILYIIQKNAIQLAILAVQEQMRNGDVSVLVHIPIDNHFKIVVLRLLVKFLYVQIVYSPQTADFTADFSGFSGIISNSLTGGKMIQNRFLLRCYSPYIKAFLCVRCNIHYITISNSHGSKIKYLFLSAALYPNQVIFSDTAVLILITIGIIKIIIFGISRTKSSGYGKVHHIFWKLSFFVQFIPFLFISI